MSSSAGSGFLRPSPSQKKQLFYATSALLIALGCLFSFSTVVFSDSYMPHAYCYLQKAGLVWTHVLADMLIGLSYTVIAICLAYLVFKGHQQIPFRWMFIAFGVFIVACGGTHFMEVLTVWVPVYVLSAVVKVITAVASVCTAIALPFTVPQALTLIRDARLSRHRQQALELALTERDRAQAELYASHSRLEQEVQERTFELTQANSALAAEVERRGQIQESVARLAEIVESSSDAIIGKDLKGSITNWNQGAEKIYGYTAEEVIGKSIALIAPTNRLGEIEEILRQLAGGRGVERFETVRVGKSGALIDVALTISPVYASAGVIVGASAIARDITAAKQAELAPRESEAQYRLLFDDNPFPMWVLDRKSLRFLAVNEAAVQHYGYARHEFFSMTIVDLQPSEGIPAFIGEMRRSIRGLQATKLCRHRKKDGSVIDVEVTAHKLNFRGTDAELILANDITKRLRSEESLRQSEERFSKAFRSSPVGITISTEAEGRYIDANPAYLEMMGYERDDIVGNTVEQLQVWAERHDRHLMIKQLDGPKPAKPIEVRFRTQSGKIRLLELTAERIRLDDTPCVLAITRDVTEVRELEQQFMQAQKMEAIGRLAGGVAHDFNNLLGVIIGFSDIAMQRLTCSNPAQKHLQQIRKAADRAATLTRQLLSFSRQQLLELRTLNLNVVIGELTKLLSHMIGEDVSLVFRPAKELGSVRADPGQVEQILMNLAVNARDAMPRGGSLAMETCNIDVDEHNAWQHTMVKHGATSENGNGKERSPPPQRLFQSSPESDISKSQRIKAYPGARLAIPAGHALSAVAQPWKMASR